MHNILFGITAFIGAFLLFAVQPMAGKIVLPVFGGAASVWTVVILFFTTILLIGYIYVVWLTKKSKNLQLKIHTVVIIITTLWLVFNFWRSGSVILNLSPQVQAMPPTAGLLYVLIGILALPSFVLSTTSTLLQMWLVGIKPKASPYWLYIISNFGSLAGLLSYPFMVEPNLTLFVQQSVWVYGFCFYAVLMILINYRYSQVGKNLPAVSKSYKLNLDHVNKWFFLPFISTGTMLALTTQLTQVINPMPFIWVITLSIYLISFIVAFIDKPWYSRKFYGLVLIMYLIINATFSTGLVSLGYKNAFAVSMLGLFLTALVAHRELFRSKPDAKGLTFYYLMIAAGGVGASIFCSFIAPNIFSDIWEYPIMLISGVLLSVYILVQTTNKTFKIHSVALGIFAIGLIVGIFLRVWNNYRGNYSSVANYRNFYGVLHVVKDNQSPPYKVGLYNGSTYHGEQNIGSDSESTPTTYYKIDSGLGRAILNYTNRNVIPNIKIGVVGLGVGTTASYCSNGDLIRFYEINKKVVEVSRNYFTYLKNAEVNGCRVEIVEGDARISLENELKQKSSIKFDVLAIDAFTDDSIPTHLITKEAISLFLNHVTPRGIVAIHISSKYFDLAPQLFTGAAEEKLYVNQVNNQDSRWILISKFPIGTDSKIPVLSNTSQRAWTDDYSSMLEAMY